jgi:hypothetical protein
MKIVHVLVTRYNVRTRFKGLDKNSNLIDSRWLESRKALFDSICLPSIMHQQSNDFLWFILFDMQTPERYFNYLDSNIIPIRAANVEDGHKKIRSHLSDIGKAYFITSRLDNDDALSINYISDLRSFAEFFLKQDRSSECPSVIHFQTGLVLDIINKKAYQREYPNSSFFSVLEGEVYPQELKFSSLLHHARVQDIYPTINVKSKEPYWIMSIHGNNVKNEAKGMIISFDSKYINKKFGIRA